jgi:guanylate kinase
MNKNKKIFIIVVGPSGSGKTTLIEKFLENHKDFEFLITSTTRKKREGEINGIDYYFFDENKFKENIQNNKFIEWAIVHKTHYGCLKTEVEKHHKNGKNIIKDFDYKGYFTIKKKENEIPYNVKGIFILPPSIESLRKRINRRNKMSKKDWDNRMISLKEEMNVADKFDVKMETFDDDIERSYKIFEKKILELMKRD